ncbi:G2484-1 protein, putative isoform 5 [Theobroma cacao]|uniref:G2484-1 protein, putative isoform 5 n=1 Tax=Theobroma cacao TaxID=3641 RepID=A0A061G4I9_THECC|nr:G2484-1 protein, putative isoform 5 [Theobroma cacao]
MDYDDNDFQSQNLHLAGEGNNKFPPVLRPYALPRFDFDDNLHGHLRFDSLVETEVFLGIESSEDNQWIEDFSRGSTGIVFSSSAAEPCSISRRNNVWSEAASSESVEMLLKSVGQDETIPGQIISKDSDACDELGCIIKQMEPSLKHGDSGLSKEGDGLRPALQAGEIPGKFSGLKGNVGGDHPLVEDVSQMHEGEPTVDGAFKDPNTISRNTDLPVTERDKSKDCEQIVVNENQVDALVDQSVDNRGQEDKFASDSQVDTLIPSLQNTCTSSALIDSQDTTHLKNDIIDETVDSLERVDSKQEVHIDGGNLDMQSKDGVHVIRNSTASVGEPCDRIVKGNSDHHMVEACSEGLGVEVPLQTGKSEDIVLSGGKLHDISPMPFVGDMTLKEHESQVSNTDSKTCTSLESKMDSMMQLTCDAIEKKDLLETDCHPDTKILSSKSEKSSSSVEDGKGSKGEGEHLHNTLGVETMRVCEEYIVTEHNDDYKCDESASAAAKQNTKLPSDYDNADCGDGGSPLVEKGVDSSSFSTCSTENELVSNIQSDVAASSKSVDSVLLPSGKGLLTGTVFNQKEVQVSSSEASFSIMKTNSGLTTEKGALCETGEQFSCKKVDQSLAMDASNAEGQSGDLTLHRVTLEGGKDMQPSSVVSDSVVRETDGAEAQVISKWGSSEAAGAVSIQQNDKTPTNPVPSTSKEPSHDPDQNRSEDSDPKLVSEEKMHHVDGDPAKTHSSSFTSVISSESQTKFHMIESGSSSVDLDNPSCGSPIVIRTSEQSQSKIEGVKRSADQSASASGVINGEASKEQSISQDTKGNDASPGDRSFTFKVPPLADMSEKEAGKNWQPFSTMQHDKLSSVVEGTPSTSGSSKVAAKTAQDASHANPQASEREKVRVGSRGTSERKTRRTGGKNTGKDAAKKGIAAKETTPARQSERSDRSSNASLSSAGIGQLIQSNEMQHYGHIEGGNMKPFGLFSSSVSSLPDLNTSASSSAVFHQPFTDLQQVQLRAQIFVYGALIQGTAPDEAYMISAFGGPDGGRSIWENAWRACIERVHGQKSHLVSPETPLQSRIGAKPSDQAIKLNAVQGKVTSSPASRSTSKGTPTTIVNPMIPLSSPLWSIPTPSGDPLQPSGIPRGAVMDYQQALSPLHPPPMRNFVGPNASWMSQSPFRGPWVPQTSAFDGNARFPVLPITETANLTPVREASVPSSGMKPVSPVPMVQSGSPANVFAGTPLLDSKKTTVTAGQHSADPKPRKRKKSTASEDPGQIMLHSQKESLLATAATGHASTPAAVSTPATIVSKSSTDKFITSVSADHLKKGDQDLDQRATISEETLSKLKESQKQAEDAAAFAAAAVSHNQEIWNKLNRHQNSGLAPDVETKLTSAAVAIAAAAAVAKAAAAAANVASNAALQAKLMADEALVSSGYRNSIPTDAISSSDSVKKLGNATPASILRGEDATISSNSVIVAAREAARRRVEAASAASKRAENMDAIVKAAELAAEAVSQAGKIVAMGEPFSLTELVKAGPEAYWKVPQVSPEPDGAREHRGKSGSVEAPGSSAWHLKEVPLDQREKQSANHGMSPTLREIARESLEDRSRLTGGILGSPSAASGKDKKGQKGRKASDIAKTKGVTSESEIGFGSPSMTTPTEHEKPGEVSKDNYLREGSHVEVLRDGGGLKIAWFLADILNLKDGKAYVCYNELRSEEDGDRLKEWVELEGEGDRAPRIRTARPITAMPFEGTRKRRRAAMGDYNWSVGDRVDTWMQDSWWEGVVTEKGKKDETSFTIHFPARGETSVVKAWLLRPSLMWKNGSWVEWSSSGDNNVSSHEGDTPQEKRLRVGSPTVEAKGKDKLSKGVDIKESGKPDDTRLLDFSASERIFNIGKSTRDESKPDSLRMIRTGLQKEGSRVIFGVPKPGKKRKFMEVSKHYVADQSSKTHETSDSAKITKYLMPQRSGPRGTKNKIELKEKRMAVSKPKVLKSGKPPSVSSRTIPQKDNLSNTMVSEPDDAVASDVSKFKDSVSHAENISGKHNVMEFRSFSSSDGAAEGPVLFSSVALSSDAPSKKTSTSNAKFERINKGKLAAAAGKLGKIEEEKVFNDNSTKTISEVVEPRRSNRRIQPTSRLLEGLQSSLIISKIPSVSHDKSHKSQSRSTRGNNHG